MYSVTYSKRAKKELLRLPRNVGGLIHTKVRSVAAAPLAPNNNVKALTGRPGYRLRVGDWRVIYQLDHGVRVLSVQRVGPRGSVYE